MAAALQSEVLFFAMDHPLVRWRYKHQLSQEELGQRSGLSQQAIAAYENYQRTPRGTSLRKLLDVTGLPLEALIFPAPFLREHPDFLAERPQRGRRRRPPEDHHPSS